MSARNTGIAKSRTRGGVRFVHNEEDGKPGEVVTRKMTPEEVAKYGEPVYKKTMLTKAGIIGAVKNSPTLEAAARAQRVSRETFVSEMKRHSVTMPEKWEVKDMGEKAEEKKTLNGIEALNRLNDLVVDIADIAEVAKGSHSPRVKKMLQDFEMAHQKEMDKINDALVKVQIEL